MLSSLKRAGRNLAAARERLDAAMQAAAEAARQAYAAGENESEIARVLGVNRITVRRWLGKM